MSTLLTGIYRLLGVKPIRTSPYHPQTDGLVERFNKTLKSMLRKTAVMEGKDWDKMLPYVLFAYREMPQASMGFSPIELLYDRRPLNILREMWEAPTKCSESIVSYVLMMRRRLNQMAELAKENLSRAQAHQKRWLLPPSLQFVGGNRQKHQHLVSWSKLPVSSSLVVPFTVVQKSSPANYTIEMPRWRKKTPYHPHQHVEEMEQA